VTEQIEKARLAYEVVAGKRVSDNHWYRTRKLLERHKLEVNVKNCQFFAELRKAIPRSAIGIEGLLDCYKKADEILNQSTKPLTGSEVLRILAQYGVHPHQTTVSRWFRGIGGYRKNREYSPAQLKSIFANAFLYKAHYSTKLPGEVKCG
jgi:hypothetical protein